MYVRLTIQNQYFAKCLSLENTHILQGKQDVSIARTAADVHPVLHARFSYAPEIWIDPGTASSRLETKVPVLSTSCSIP